MSVTTEPQLSWRKCLRELGDYHLFHHCCIIQEDRVLPTSPARDSEAS